MFTPGLWTPKPGCDKLAEATERPVEPSAQAGFLEETPATMAQARC
jgi:hypothetical protein